MREADVELSQEYALHEDASGICKWLVCDLMGRTLSTLKLLSLNSMEDWLNKNTNLSCDVCLSVHTCCMSVCPHVMYVCLSTRDVCLSVHT